MLSVRSLKRIAQKAGLSPAPAPPFVKIDAGEDGNEASSPSPGAKVARKAGKHARIVTPNEKDAAEARDPSEPCCTCPDPAEVRASFLESWARVTEMLLEVWYAGGGNLLFGVGLFFVLVSFFQWMLGGYSMDAIKAARFEPWQMKELR